MHEGGEGGKRSVVQVIPFPWKLYYPPQQKWYPHPSIRRLGRQSGNGPKSKTGSPIGRNLFCCNAIRLSSNGIFAYKSSGCDINRRREINTVKARLLAFLLFYVFSCLVASIRLKNMRLVMQRARGIYFAALTTAALGAAGLCPNSASATTWTLDASNGCNTGCTTGPFGSVTVTASSGVLHFIVSLFGTYNFMGGTDTFAFSLNGSPTVAFSNFVPNTFTASNTTAGSFNMDGFGKFMYGVTAPGNGGSSPGGQSLVFDVTAAGGLTLADLIKSTTASNTNELFAADICPLAGCGEGLTGFAGGGPSTGGGGAGGTPIPGALPLFGSVLGGGFLFSKWRKKRRAA